MSERGSNEAEGRVRIRAEKANALRWDGARSPFYEVYYVTANDVANARGLWLRLTLHANRAKPAHAAVWGFAFDARDPKKNFAARQDFSLDAFAQGDAPWSVRVGDSALDARGTGGLVEGGGRRLAWDLAWEPAAAARWHFPQRWMYRGPFPSTKILAPAAAVSVSGTVELDGATWTLAGARGQQAHLWGTRHAESWVWGRAAGEDWNFEGLAAVARSRFPQLAAFFLTTKDASYAWNGLRALRKNASRHGADSWKFSTEWVHGARLVGELAAPVEASLAVRYDDPTEGERWCNHTEVADATLTLERRGAAPRTFTVAKGAAFETGSRERELRIRAAL
ncbi:MAG: hypothetical protein ACYDCK_12940 [Thermoplasmatota archaeon]